MTEAFRIAVKHTLRSGEAWMWVLANGQPELFDADAAQKQLAAWRSQNYEAVSVAGPPFVLPEDDQ